MTSEAKRQGWADQFLAFSPMPRLVIIRRGMKLYKSVLPIYRDVDSNIVMEMYRWFHRNQYESFAPYVWGEHMPPLDEEVAGATQLAFVVVSEKQGSYGEVVEQIHRARGYGLFVVGVMVGDPEDYAPEIGYSVVVFLNYDDPRFYRLFDKAFSWARFDHPWQTKKHAMTSLSQNYFDYCDYNEDPELYPNLDVTLGSFSDPSFVDSNLMHLKNVWVYGKQGSGRLSYVNQMVLNLLRTNVPSRLQFMFFDPLKRMDYYDRLRFLYRDIARDQQELWDGIYALEDEMHRRLNILDANGKFGNFEEHNKTAKKKFPYIIAVVDEAERTNMLDGIGIVSKFGPDVGIYFIVIGNDENNEFFSFPTKIEISGPRDPIYICGPDCPKQKCFRFYLSERKFLACVEKFYKD